MQVIHLPYPVKSNIIPSKIILVLGFFDGVHLGHQHLITVAKDIAQEKKLPLAVMTFDRHPREVYANKFNFKYIDTIDEKAEKMANLGVDYLLIAPFTEGFSKISGQEFVDNVIVKLNADTVVAGFDYTYGPKKIANMDNLPKFAKERFQIVKVAKQTFSGQKIGSTVIRKAIKNGEMEEAYDLLGHHYQMSGTIGHGERNGHKIGFPTANLVWDKKKLCLKLVYMPLKLKLMVNGMIQ